VFSEYHAGGSDTAFYMLRKGQFKYIAYVGYPSELFDLFAAPRRAATYRRIHAMRPSFRSSTQNFLSILMRPMQQHSRPKQQRSKNTADGMLSGVAVIRASTVWTASLAWSNRGQR